MIAFSVTALTGQIPNIKPADLNLGEKIGLGLVPVGGLAVGAAIKGGIHLHQKRKANQAEQAQQEAKENIHFLSTRNVTGKIPFSVFTEAAPDGKIYYCFVDREKVQHKFYNETEANQAAAVTKGDPYPFDIDEFGPNEIFIDNARTPTAYSFYDDKAGVYRNFNNTHDAVKAGGRWERTPFIVRKVTSDPNEQVYFYSTPLRTRFEFDTIEEAEAHAATAKKALERSK